MRYGLTWDDKCVADLAELFGNLETADDAMNAIDWRLARDPFGRGTWELSPKSDIRLALLRPHRGFPAVAFSYRVMEDERGPNCVMLRARPANVPALS